MIRFGELIFESQYLVTLDIATKKLGLSDLVAAYILACQGDSTQLKQIFAKWKQNITENGYANGESQNTSNMQKYFRNARKHWENKKITKKKKRKPIQNFISSYV